MQRKALQSHLNWSENPTVIWLQGLHSKKKKNSEGSTAEEEANISNFDATVFFEVTVS